MTLFSRACGLADGIRRRVAPRRTDQFSRASLGNSILAGQRLVAIDVGAALGLLPHWHLLDSVSHIYQIEPRPEACEELQRVNVLEGMGDTRRVLCAAVAGTEGPRTLYVSNAPTGTSLLRMNPAAERDCGDYVDSRYLFPITERQITTRRLGSLMDEASEVNVDLVKLDIQGAELEALQGLGSSRLANLLGVELEVGMHAFYPKEARFPAVDQFMEENGFELFDVRVARVRRPLGVDGYESAIFSVDSNSPTVAARLWEFDVIYFRKKSILLDRRDGGAIRRMALVYATYNFYSEAHSLVEKAQAAEIFDDETAHDLKQLIVDLHFVANYRPWLADTRFWRAVRRIGVRLSPRNAPRWCQHMYQGYPNG
jgi:FkbM family methyltransferase